ncbi:unnamed protein product [Rotaria sp. Silwood2]|nr:unnamed protein product [Rotaria sp. Silwood2]CAF4597639.1 unnamed protein product [Rotaria sp. Silwood2]
MMLLLLFILVLVFNAADSTDLSCPNRQFIEHSLNKVHIPGAVIIVVNASDILYEQAFGYQSLSPIVAMDLDKSIFILASISKTFIGVAVMQLVPSEKYSEENPDYF